MIDAACEAQRRRATDGAADDRHLEDCDACATFVRALASVETALAEGDPRDEPAPAMVDAVRLAIYRDRERRSSRSMALACAALAIVLGAGWWWIVDSGAGALAGRAVDLTSGGWSQLSRLGSEATGAARVPLPDLAGGEATLLLTLLAAAGFSLMVRVMATDP